MISPVDGLQPKLPVRLSLWPSAKYASLRCSVSRRAIRTLGVFCRTTDRSTSPSSPFVATSHLQYLPQRVGAPDLGKSSVTGHGSIIVAKNRESEAVGSIDPHVVKRLNNTVPHFFRRLKNGDRTGEIPENRPSPELKRQHEGLKLSGRPGPSSRGLTARVFEFEDRSPFVRLSAK